MDLLNTIQGKMNSVQAKLKSQKYRKYVWNDFSIVEKARIQFLSYGKEAVCTFPPEHPFDLVAELPVQINPKSYRFDCKMRPHSIMRGLESGSAEDKYSVVSYGEPETSGGDDIPLDYDIYDEYYARSMGGALTKDFSLMSPDVTSLPDLVFHARRPHLYVMFIWGNIKRFGTVAGIEVTYTAFSQWGQPLKATANLKINDLPIDTSKITISGDTKHLSSISEAKTTAKKVLTGIKNIFR